MILLTRTILGGIFLCFGANEIFKINPVQWWSEPEALSFVQSLKETGYFTISSTLLKLFLEPCLLAECLFLYQF